MGAASRLPSRARARPRRLRALPARAAPRARRGGRERARANAERIVALREASRARRRARRAACAPPLPAPRPRPQRRLRALQRDAHGRLARPALPPPRRGVPPLPSRLPARARRRAARLLPAADRAAARPRRLRGHPVRGQRARPRAPAPPALLQPGRRDAEPPRRLRGRHGRRDRRAGASRRARRAAAHSYAPLVATVVAGTGNHYVLDAVAGAALGRAAKLLA